jgi:histidine triad (HIT) family protein
MCLFCKIVNHDIPSKIIYEDDYVVGILDISQTTKGHTLIIPKKHVENILECPEDVLNNVFNAVSFVGNHLIKTLNAKGMNVLSNVNEIAGQSIMHFHVHLIPRYGVDDGFVVKMMPSNQEATTELTEYLKI